MFIRAEAARARVETHDQNSGPSIGPSAISPFGYCNGIAHMDPNEAAVALIADPPSSTIVSTMGHKIRTATTTFADAIERCARAVVEGQLDWPA
jgi:hypothetical protein